MNEDRDLTFYQFYLIFASRWRFIFVSCLICLSVAILKFKFYPTYTGTGRLIIKDFNNSQLQLSLIQVANPEEEKKSAISNSEESFSQTEAFLDSHFFYLKLSNKLLDLYRLEKESFFSDFLKSNNLNINDPLINEDLADKLQKFVSFQKIKSNVLTVEAKTSSRELSTKLVNESLIVAKNEIIDRELQDLSMAEKYFSDELNKKKLTILMIENKTLSKMNNKKVFSLSSEKNENLDYINELRRNINNIKIEILSNNSKMASFGKLNDNAIGAGEKYTLANQVFAIQEQNKFLQLKLAVLNDFLVDFEKNQSKLLPLEYEIEQQNSLHQLEYKVFESLKASLAKIGLQKLYVQNKVSILEFERPTHLSPSPSLMILVLSSQALAFCLSFFVIFCLELLNDKESIEDILHFNNALA